MALELAAAEQPDLALIGEKLAGLDGAAVCRAMKADGKLGKIPVVFMRTDRPGPVPDHADAILTKPFSPQSLLDTVRQFLKTSVGDGTSPVPILNALDEGLEEELIDQALGLDDVGPTPGEELNIPQSGVADGLGAAELKEVEEAQPLGLVEQETPEPDDVASNDTFDSALDEAFSFADDPPASNRQPKETPAPEERIEEAQPLELESVQASGDDEVDDALDAAFGEVSASESDSSSSDETDHSLKEVSLGVDKPAAIDFPDDTPAASSAGPSGTIDLGGSEVQEDKPHDYDWFIKEMQETTTNAANKPASPPNEPPKIEPVTTIPASEVHITPPAEIHGPVTSDEIKVEGSDEVKPSRAGYDEFISEFKAEIAKIEGMAPPDDAAPVEETQNTKHSHSGQIFLENADAGKEPPATPPPAPSVPATAEEVARELGDGLIDSVTAHVARELAAKIDSKVIYQLIEQKLKEAQKNEGA
jgi:hypothetical protein